MTIANCWDQINIEFSLTRDTILEWKLRKTILQLHKPRELRTKDGSHIVPIRICGYLIKHNVMKIASDKVSTVQISFSGFFLTRESIHSNLDQLSLLLCWEVYNSYAHMTVLLEIESNNYIGH